MSAREVVGLVLAAGTSSRMGPDRNKLLETVRGRPLVTIPIEAMRDAGVGRVVVVLGYEANRVGDCLPAGVESLVHEDYAGGMGTSLAVGARHVRATAPAAAILVCVADLPGLSSDPVRDILVAFESAASDAILVPTAGGRRGHPVLFGPDRTVALEACDGHEGARSVVRAAGPAVVEVEVGTTGIHHDVDTPEDLAR